MKKFTLVLIFFASLVFDVQAAEPAGDTTKARVPAKGKAQADGQYKMIDDTFNGYPEEVCHAFLENLQSLPAFPPMACEVKFNPKFADFKTPEWKDIDAWENRDLELQLYESKRLPSQGPITEAERALIMERLKQRIDAKQLLYRTAYFDIDNDGVPETVMMSLYQDNCSPYKADTRLTSFRGYFIYDPVTHKVNFEKSNIYGAAASGNSIFIFKDKTYFVELMGGITNKPYFGKNDFAKKWLIKIERAVPNAKDESNATDLGCEYVYKSTNHKGGY